MSEENEAALTVSDWARHLVRVAADVRLAGDLSLVRFSDDGVTDAACTLSDELYIVAMNLDYEAAMDESSKEQRR